MEVSDVDHYSCVDAQVAEFIQKIQRDLNCTRDPDRSTRKRALERLHQYLTYQADPPSLLQIAWDRTLLQIMLKSLSDPVEKCRELAVTLISDTVHRLPEVQGTLTLLAPAIAERIGQSPFLEQSEEIRLALLSLLSYLIGKCSVDAIDAIFYPLSQIICTTLCDSFHEVKKAACQMIVVAGAQGVTGLREHLDSLLGALVSNVGHSHSRVRLAVLNAMDAVVRSGLLAGMFVDSFLPATKMLAFDHSPAVRELLFSCVAGWLRLEVANFKIARMHAMQLLPLLLLGTTDESLDIVRISLSLFEEIGVSFGSQAFHLELQPEKNLEELGNRKCSLDIEFLLSTPFKGRPQRGCCMIVQESLGQLLRPVLSELREWTSVVRVGAARQLYIILILAEERAANFLDLLVPALCSAVGDDDVNIAQYVVKAAQALGYYVSPQSWSDIIMDHLTSSKSSDAQRANTLVVLSGLLYKVQDKSWTNEQLLQLCESLSQCSLYSIDHPGVKRQLLAVLTNIIRVLGVLCECASTEILALLLKIQSTGNTQIEKSAADLTESFSKVIGLSSSKDLYSKHINFLLSRAIIGSEEWTESSHGRKYFRTILYTSGSAVVPYLRELLPVFAKCLHPERDPALRISTLQLLDDLFENADFHTFWSEVAVEVITRLLLPCGVWQVGKVGAAVRHATMVALGTFLRQGLCNAVDLIELFERGQMLPIIKSCIDEDFYVDTRRVTCHVLENVITICGGVLKDEQRCEIGHMLEKRLDDSNDDVRSAALRAILIYFQAMPSTYSEENVQRFVDTLLIHINDQNNEIKEAAYKAVEQCALKRPSIVTQAVQFIAKRQHSTQYTDKLLEICKS